MSEKTRGYMAELDRWTDQVLIQPVWEAARKSEPDDQARQSVLDPVRKAVREKVLESYRNGQKAGPRREPAGKPGQK